MKLDKELYRKACEEYRRWNQDELDEVRRFGGDTRIAEMWKRYLDQIDPARLDSLRTLAEWERAEKMFHVDRYYARVMRLQARRFAHSQARRAGTPS